MLFLWLPSLLLRGSAWKEKKRGGKTPEILHERISTFPVSPRLRVLAGSTASGVSFGLCETCIFKES